MLERTRNQCGNLYFFFLHLLSWWSRQSHGFNSTYRLLISFPTLVLFSELWCMYVFKCLFNFSMVILNKHFKTKESKTESFIFSPKTCVSYSLSRLNQWQLNFPNFSDQKPKVTLDFILSLTSHMQFICKSCWFYFQNISRAQQFLTTSTANNLATPSSLIA